jgi:peptidyl-dipeptidase A
MKTAKHACVILSFLIGGIFLSSCSSESGKAEAELRSVIDDFVTQYKPLKEKYQLAYYSASVSGDENEYKNAAELQVSITKLLSDKNRFAKIKDYKNSKLINDSILNKQLNVLYNLIVPFQADEKDLAEAALLEMDIIKKYSVFRPQIDGKAISDTEIDDVLANSQDTKTLEKYWNASKQVGIEVCEDIIKLVRLRNKIAEAAGYKNYYEMMVSCAGQDLQKIDEIYEELDFSTRGPYTQVKSEIDNFLALFLNKPATDLQVWDYQDRFFQNPPEIYSVDFDKYYKNINPAETVKQFYSSIGIDISDILQKSELQYNEKQRQAPYTADIDRQGDVRILVNATPTQKGINSLMYESGFAASYKFIDKELPYLLKEPADFVVSDASAQLFAQLTTDVHWISANTSVTSEDIQKLESINKRSMSLSKFVFARWALVMYNFEKSIYTDPSQDMNELWWNLVEKYQMLKKPAGRSQPDWAAKSHIVNQPCTYHNYMLGEMLASQLKSHILKTFENGNKDFSKESFKNKKIGEFLTESVFKPGKSIDFNLLIKNITGSDLSPDYFTKEYIEPTE